MGLRGGHGPAMPSPSPEAPVVLATPGLLCSLPPPTPARGMNCRLLLLPAKALGAPCLLGPCHDILVPNAREALLPRGCAEHRGIFPQSVLLVARVSFPQRTPSAGIGQSSLCTPFPRLITVETVILDRLCFESWPKNTQSTLWVPSIVQCEPGNHREADTISPATGGEAKALGGAGMRPRALWSWARQAGFWHLQPPTVPAQLPASLTFSPLGPGSPWRRNVEKE